MSPIGAAAFGYAPPAGAHDPVGPVAAAALSAAASPPAGVPLLPLAPSV